MILLIYLFSLNGFVIILNNYLNINIHLDNNLFLLFILIEKLKRIVGELSEVFYKLVISYKKMVKNSTGGNKSKKMARKNQNSKMDYEVKEVRKAMAGSGEMYAVVSKLYGGRECQVMCLDGKSRRCVIRTKFSWKTKSENVLSIGVWVLVGMRDWEVRQDGTEKCDLLEVYSRAEKDKLRQVEKCNFGHLLTINTNDDDKKDELFSGKSELELEEVEEKQSSEENNDEFVVESTDESASEAETEEASKVAAKPQKKTESKQKTASLADILKSTQKLDINKDNDWMINVDDI